MEPISEDQAFETDLCGDSDAEDEFLYTSSAESSRPGSFRADGSSSKRARTSLFPESKQQPVSNVQEVSDVAIPLLYEFRERGVKRKMKILNGKSFRLHLLDLSRLHLRKR